MDGRSGVLVSGVAAVLLVAALVAPYLAWPVDAINTYYARGVLNPLFAGALAIVVLAVTSVDWRRGDPTDVSAGIALGAGLAALLVTVVWAGTARLDVFLARGWAMPLQRYVLVGLAGLLVVGAAWQARTSGLLGTSG